MKIILALPLKSSKDPLIDLGQDYLKRLRPPLTAKPLFLPPKSAISETQKEKRMELEGSDLLQKTEGYFRIALADHGKTYSSDQFATYLQHLMTRSPKTAFIIGGAFGLSKSVIDKSDAVLSLSAMTLPHRMAFLLLSEQLYRAMEIIYGTPYHK